MRDKSGDLSTNNPKKEAGEKISLEKKGSTPDIYYIVLDAFSGDSALRESYSYDNFEFTNSLKNKGFFVTSKSVSNYRYTHQSLAATLNMEYINYLDGAENFGDLRVTYQMIYLGNEVTKFLKSKGYKYIHYDSGWGPTQFNDLADNLVHGTRFSEFQVILLNTTMVTPFMPTLTGEKRRERILNTFSKIPIVSKNESPKFVFAHITSPHYPFIFEADGSPVEDIGPKLSGDRAIAGEKYLNQLIFISKKVDKLVEEILSNSKKPPIIILQADHGKNFDSDSQDIIRKEGYFKDGYSIFNAFYLPSGGNDVLYDTVTPVNTFRIIFNYYFGTDYELLSDKSYDSIAPPPYNFEDVTELISH